MKLVRTATSLLDEDFQIIWHRWSWINQTSNIRENSLEWFNKAMEIWANWVELDIYMRDDWELIVFHEWSGYISNYLKNNNITVDNLLKKR